MKKLVWLIGIVCSLGAVEDGIQYSAQKARDRKTRWEEQCEGWGRIDECTKQLYITDLVRSFCTKNNLSPLYFKETCGKDYLKVCLNLRLPAIYAFLENVATVNVPLDENKDEDEIIMETRGEKYRRTFYFPKEEKDSESDKSE